MSSILNESKMSLGYESEIRVPGRNRESVAQLSSTINPTNFTITLYCYSTDVINEERQSLLENIDSFINMIFDKVEEINNEKAASNNAED